mmetsp:Transcript_35905/g.83871  ORF Transcript_35905/g.83871 Transcript_35905/m.83871 type:complete len:211 (+) Transcript_35905:485-1117(+)
MDVGLVLPSLGFSNVDVRKAELVLQATDLAKPVLVCHDCDAFSMPALFSCHLVLNFPDAFVDKMEEIILISTFIFLIVFVGFELLSDSDRMELVTRRDHALGVKLRPETLDFSAQRFPRAVPNKEELAVIVLLELRITVELILFGNIAVGAHESIEKSFVAIHGPICCRARRLQGKRRLWKACRAASPKAPWAELSVSSFLPCLEPRQHT